MHKLFLVYFINIYMFQAYLGPSSGGTIVCTQLSVALVGLELQFIQDNRQSSKKNNRYQLLYTYSCTS
jgi:hypothetical protein